MLIALVALLGLVGGVVIGWLVAISRAAAAGARVEAELRQQLSSRDADLQSLRGREFQLIAENAAAITARNTATGQLEASQKQAADWQSKADNWQQQCTVTSNTLAQTAANLDAANSRLEETRDLHATQLKEAQDAQKKALDSLREAFASLSGQALKGNSEEFLRLAQQTFGSLRQAASGDLTQRQEAIAGLLKPLEEHLKAYQARLQQSENAQAKALGDVTAQVSMLGEQNKALAKETEQLRSILHSSQARGRWGEQTLRRVVEAAGMSAHCDFVEQEQQDSNRPDMLVKLPGDRVIIVDSKAPELAAIAILDDADAAKRSELLESHAKRVRDTVKMLAQRCYQDNVSGSLDYVVLFLPAESLFSTALEGDNDLIAWAAEQKVLLATPATLIALLRSVAVSWQCYTQTQNAKEMVEHAKELYDRVQIVIEHLAGIGNGLSKASEAYNKAVGSYITRVQPSARRLQELGITQGQPEEPELPPVTVELRQLPA